MTAFAYRNGALHAEGVSLVRLADRIGTPAYVYSNRALVERYRAFATAFAGLDALVCYSVKANSNLAVIATFARLGAGADVVSQGELFRARAAGVPANRIVFAGVGKTEAEMEAGLKARILQFNVESENELRLLARVASQLKRRAPVAMRINPDVDARTHAKISTGKSENKFGIEIPRARELARLAATLPGIDLQGLAVHIGSQLTSVEPFAAAFARMAELARELIAAGHGIRRLDMGGGLGIVYDRETPPDLASYARAVRDAVDGLPIQIVLEPGRYLVAEAGILLSRVIYMKEGTAKRFAIVDAAMNDLIRPALYDAYQPILPVARPRPGANLATVDVVGPVCETGDVIAPGRALPPLDDGDLIAIGGAGAYGAVMSSTYNTRPLAPEILVDGARYAVVRPRQDYAELIGRDRLAPWLKAPAAAKRKTKKKK
ncbi:MAG: diaminopimelate decarboxylase [Rhodospirillales bacterium]|nr:diaminopimelate decarboxylase [Rhodospirillales bacterium]